MNTYDQKQYLIRKYEEDDCKNNEIFNPNINPNLNYIPICSQCSSDFDNFRNDVNLQNSDDIEVEMKHPRECLWNEYFLYKIKNICPSAKIVRKKKRKDEKEKDKIRKK
jgi:hypothetical protein